MNESSMPDDAVPARAATAGMLLRAARERQGLHLAVLAASLKVSPRKLEMIEGDRLDELPDATFVRALALSMCRALKIDPEPVLSQLPQPQGRTLDDISPGLNQPFRDRDARTDTIEWPRLLNLPVIGAVLLVVAAVVLYRLPPAGWSLSALRPAASLPVAADAPGPGNSAGAAPVFPPTDQAPPTADAAPAPGGVAASAPADSTESAAAALFPPAATPVPTATPAPAASDPAAAPTAGLLGLRASAQSWVEVRDAGGQVLLSRHLSAGEAVNLDGTPPLHVVIGNAGATQVSFRGQPVTLSPSRENVVRLELP